MIDNIIAWSIKNKFIVGLLVIALIAWGGISLYFLPIDAVPDITNNQVQVITVSPALSAQDIERLVTFPVEQTMATIPGILEMRSFSRFGLSVLTIVFEENIDIYWARQQISERLTEAKSRIPAGAGSPEMMPLTTGLGEIFQYVIHPKPGYEKKFNAMELRTIQDWLVRRQLLGTEGVADVSSFGGYLKQYEIAVDPARLQSAGINMDEILAALDKNNQNTGGAYIDKKPQAWFIRSEGLINTTTDIENVVIKNTEGGLPVLIRDVAVVKLGHATRYGALTRNNEGEAVGAIVMMLKGANSSRVIKNVKERIEAIKQNLPEGVEITPFLDRTKLVNHAIGTVSKNLAEGALIVIFVLVLLLGNLRAGIIVATVIPLAMLFAVGMMRLFGVSGNLMSLGAIDFGLIVDGAVIIVEATMHHLGLRQVTGRLTQEEMDREVFDSARKIRKSAAFGEIIILIVYLPILALSGIEGKMFKPMAQTVSFAILGAFILSLTYVPMASALFLSKTVSHKKNISDRIMSFFQRVYQPALRFSLKNKIMVVSIALVAFAGSLVIFSGMGGEFIPSLDEGDFAVETRLMPGSSLSQTVDVSLKAAEILKKNFPEVKEVIGKIGSSEIPTDPMPVEACDLMVILKDKKEWVSAETREELAEKMAARLEAIPGVNFGFQQPIQMRFNELMTGARQDVVIKIYGEDLEQLTRYAEQAGRLASTVEGAEDIYVEKATGLQQVVVTLDRAEIARYGLDVETVNRTLRMGFAGEAAGQLYEGERRFDIVVRLDTQNRTSMADVKNLYIPLPGGKSIPLEQVAQVKMVNGPNQIQRDDAKRRIVMGFNVRGRDVESIVNEVKSKMEKEIQFQPGYYATFGGTFKNLEEARTRLSFAVPVALALIFILLYFTFGSVKYGLLIFTAIPLSAIGGVLALWLRGLPFSISAGVGFIALFGVAVLNGIVLVAEFNRLRKQGYTDLNKIIIMGTQVRLRPVIMTAMVASLGFLPMALSGSAGAEVQRPLATVVIGGLISATLLTLLVLPVLYIYFDRINFKKKPAVLALIIGILIIPSMGNSQSLTLDSAIAIAKENNLGIKAARLEVQHTERLRQTSSDIGKTNVNLLYGQYNSINTDNNITISQTLPFPTVFARRNSLAGEEITGSRMALAVNENELAYMVKQAWYKLLYAVEVQKLLIEQDSIYNEVVKSSTARYTAGETHLLEKATAEARLGALRNTIKQNTADVAIAYSQLKTLLNSKDTIIPREDFYQENDLLQLAGIGNNPLLQWMRQQEIIALERKKLLKAEMLPDITVGYFSQTLIGVQDISGSPVYYGPGKRFTGLQAGITIPLWFLPQTAKVKAAEIEREISQAKTKNTELELANQQEQAKQEYLKSLSSLEYYETTALANAGMLTEHSRKTWLAGEINYFDYLSSLNTALEMRQGYLAALLNHRQAVITIEYLSGIN